MESLSKYIDFSRELQKKFEPLITNPENEITDLNGSATSADELVQIEIGCDLHICGLTIDSESYPDIDVDELSESIIEAYSLAVNETRSAQFKSIKQAFKNQIGK